MHNKKIKVLEYYHDKTILNRIKNGEKYIYLITEPEETEIVLGKSMSLEKDVFIENCIEDNIPIYRRRGGGGTVVLSKGILIISVGGISNIPFHFLKQMNSINNIIIKALNYLGIENLSIKGISDITIGDKKILGSSFYNSRNIVLYQGSLLFNPDFNIFDRYLKHPEKTPDYRQDRNHRNFLTSIVKEKYNIDLEQLKKTISKYLAKSIPWKNLFNRKISLHKEKNHYIIS